MALTWDPEFAKEAAAHLALGTARRADLYDVEARRRRLASLYGELMANKSDLPDIKVSEHKVPTIAGQEINVFRYYKTEPQAPGPAIIYTHGGGFVAGDVVNMYAKALKGYVKVTGIQFFAPEYGLAPENPFPGPTEDVYATLEWVQKNASQLGVDPARIALMGDSSGGGISAGVALMARDRALSPPLAKQILIYPMLDDSTPRKERTDLHDFLLMWNEADNETGWAALLGEDDFGEPHISPYAAPVRVKDASNLPSTYIDVGTLDMFHDECVAYAEKLRAAGVQVESHVFDGVPHGWELFAPRIPITQKAVTARLKAMKSF